MTLDSNGSISIIIPTFGQEESVQKCLSAIRDSSPYQKEIIVVDDGYGTEFEDVINLRNPENLGFGASVNKGIAHASSEHLFIVNSDVYVFSNCFEEMVFALENHTDIVGAKLYYPDMTIQHAGINYFSNGMFYHYFWHYKEGGDLPVYCPVTGALMGFKRSVLNKIDDFEERFYIGYEDVEFCMKARSVGLKVLYWPKAQAIHVEGMTRKSVTGQSKKDREQEGRKYFMSKYTDKELRELCKPCQFQ